MENNYNKTNQPDLNEIRKLEERKKSLLEAVEQTKKKKSAIIPLVQELVSQLNSGRITRREHDEKLSRALGGRNAEHWIKYYDDYLDYYNYQIKLCDRLISQEKSKTIKQNVNKFAVPVLKIFIVLVIIGIFISLIFILGPTMFKGIGNISEKVSSSFSQGTQKTLGETLPTTPETTPAVGEEQLPSIELIIPVVLENSAVIINNEELIQSPAVVGQPVKWKKQFTTDAVTGFTIELPEGSENVNVTTIENGQEKDITNITNIGEKWIGKEIKVELKSSKITGNAIEDSNSEEQEFEIEYETPASNIDTESLANGERFIVTGPDSVHYTNVFSYSKINESLGLKDKSKLKFYEIKNNQRIETQYNLIDSDENGLMDTIEWMTPGLSQAEFLLIIEITKAELLNEDKKFVEDIYEIVKAKDNNWKLIPNNYYVRATFEQKLDNTKDITLYARGNGNVEVYGKDSEQKLIDFEINGEQEYKKFLTELEDGVNQDVFDLRFIGDIEVDWIVDPTEIPNIAPDINFTFPTPANGNVTTNNFIPINVSVNDTLRGNNNVSVFIDFNKTLVGWWRMDDDLPDLPAGLNYDEYADLYSCEGSWDSSYPCSNNYDGNWSTLAKSTSSPAYYYFNYTKPIGALNSSFLTFKVNQTSFITYTNESIPNGCWDQNVLQFRESLTNPGTVGIYCWSGTIWQNVGSIYAGSSYLYEEAMWWNISRGVVYDNSSWGNNGTIMNGAVQIDSGAIGKAMSFDGVDDYVDVENVPYIGTGNLTFSLWIRSDDLSGADNSIIFIGNEAGSQSLYFYRDTVDRVHFGTWGIGPPSVPYANDNEIFDGTWHYLTGIKSGDNLKFYLDGILRDSKVLTGLNIGTSYLNIGGKTNQYFNGSIDDVMIFKRALSAEEIIGLYANTSQKYLFNNFTNLFPGNYTFKAYAQDLAGNVNWTETREIKIKGDDIAPSINFTNPTPSNGNVTTNNFIPINVSVNDTLRGNNNVSVFIDFNKTLVGWWRMDDYNTLGIYDNSSYNNFGSFAGGMSSANSIDGKLGKAMSFDGVNDYVNLTKMDSHFNSKNITMGAWIYPKNFSGYQTILGNSEDNNAQIEMWLYNGNLTYGLHTDVGYFWIDYGPKLSVNQWQYVLITYDGAPKIYVNGILNYSTGSMGNIITENIEQTTKIGGRSSSRFFNGSIDDVIIFKRALSPEEIAGLYANTSVKYLFRNFTNLQNGNYTFKAYAQDTAGNVNSTETREVKVDSLYVAGCMDLTQANRVYTQTANIISGRGDDCIKILAQNITLDCQGNYIDINENFAGVYSNQFNTTIKNCNISMGYTGGTGIYFVSSVRSTIQNTIVTNNLKGIYLSSSSNNLLKNITAKNNNNQAFRLDSNSNNNQFSDIIVNNTLSGLNLESSSNNTFTNITTSSNTYGFLFVTSSNNTIISMISYNNIYGGDIESNSNNNRIIDSNISLSKTESIRIISNSINNTFLNVTYNNSDAKENVPFGSQLIRKWYYQANITYNNLPVNNANLSAYNITGIPAGWQFNLTNDVGNIASISSGTNGCSGGQGAVRWGISGDHQYSFIPGSVFLVSGNDISNDGYYIVCEVVYSSGTTFIATTSLSAGHNMGAIGGYVYSALTNITTIIDYINSGGTRNYYSNYTINTTNGSLSEQHQLNVTNKSSIAGFGGLIFENIILGISAPQIIWVQNISNVTPNSGGVRDVTFNFTAYSPGGFENLNDSSARANFTMPGYAPVRQNLTCSKIANWDNYANYSCTIGMWYFDQGGMWNVSVAIADNSGNWATNSSSSFKYEFLYSFSMVPNYVNWSNIEIGQSTDKLSDSNMTIRNLGNANILNLTINASRLNGTGAYPADFIPANNFSFANSSYNPCDLVAGAKRLSEGQNVSVNLFINYSKSSSFNSANNTIGFCLKGLPSGLRAQEYKTETGKDWNIDVIFGFFISMKYAVLLVGVTIKKRKKKERGENKLSELDYESLLSLDLLLKNKYKTSIRELLKEAERKESDEIKLEIPICIFKNKLSPAEALCKYMKENLEMKYSEISKMINRDERSVWTNYNNAIKKSAEKMKEKISVDEEINVNNKISVDKRMLISIDVISNRKLSILESLVKYLREKGYRNVDIAEILGKDQRNVYTLYNRAMKKVR